MDSRHRPIALIVAFLSGCSIVAAQTPCDPLPPPTGPVIEKWPADADGLRSTIAGASSGTTILLHDGFYDMSGGDSTSTASPSPHPA
jgi:hypothetical protein